VFVKCTWTPPSFEGAYNIPEDPNGCQNQATHFYAPIDYQYYQYILWIYCRCDEHDEGENDLDQEITFEEYLVWEVMES
jgi:hypothetical protein